MFRWLWGETPPACGLTLKQAQSIIEAEIARRGWSRFDVRFYSRFRTKDGLRWHCQGFLSGMRGPVMGIEIDAQTGELMSAGAGGR